MVEVDSQALRVEAQLGGRREGGNDVVHMGRPVGCDGAAGFASHPPPLPTRGDAVQSRRFYLSVTHDDVELAAPLFVVDHESCRARALGRGVTATGGYLHATRPQVLQVACACSDGPRLANVTVTLTLQEFTNPVWSYMQVCTGPQ